VFQTENPRFYVVPRNEPRYLLNIHANELYTGLSEFLVELRQSLRKHEVVRIDDGYLRDSGEEGGWTPNRTYLIDLILSLR
jgi:hypothetical protein